MFNFISWQQYIVFITIASGVYYLAIWIIFFKAKLPSFSAIGNPRSLSVHSDHTDDAVQPIIKELRPVFNNSYTKNELIHALQTRLKKYSKRDEPGFRENINEYIALESELKCSILLSEEDLRVLWGIGWSA